MKVLFLAVALLAALPSYAANYTPGAVAPFTVSSGGGAGCQEPDLASIAIPSLLAAGWHCDTVRSIDFSKMGNGGTLALVNPTGKSGVWLGGGPTACGGGFSTIQDTGPVHNYLDSLGAHQIATISGSTVTTGAGLMLPSGFNNSETTFHLPANYYLEYSWSANSGSVGLAFWTWGFSPMLDPSNNLPYGVEIDDNEGAGINWFLSNGGGPGIGGFNSRAFGHYNGGGWDGNFYHIGRLRNNGNTSMFEEGGSVGSYKAVFSWPGPPAMPDNNTATYPPGGPTVNIPQFTGSRDWYIWDFDESGSCFGGNYSNFPHDGIIKYYHVYIPP